MRRTIKKLTENYSRAAKISSLYSWSAPTLSEMLDNLKTPPSSPQHQHTACTIYTEVGWVCLPGQRSTQASRRVNIVWVNPQKHCADYVCCAGLSSCFPWGKIMIGLLLLLMVAITGIFIGFTGFEAIQYSLFKPVGVSDYDYLAVAGSLSAPSYHSQFTSGRDNKPSNLIDLIVKETALVDLTAKKDNLGNRLVGIDSYSTGNSTGFTKIDKCVFANKTTECAALVDHCGWCYLLMDLDDIFTVGGCMAGQLEGPTGNFSHACASWRYFNTSANLTASEPLFFFRLRALMVLPGIAIPAGLTVFIVLYLFLYYRYWDWKIARRWRYFRYLQGLHSHHYAAMKEAQVAGPKQEHRQQEGKDHVDNYVD